MIKNSIPNLLTLSNLFCGCLGIVFAFNNQLEWSAYMIFVAAIFDFLDGFVARLLNASSAIGAQLDSLADMVTFSLLPGIIMMQLISVGQDSEGIFNYSLLGFLIPVFGALRLAKFNVDENQSTTFIGVPTPAVAIFVAGLPLVLNSYGINFYNVIEVNILDELSQLYRWSRMDVTIIQVLQSSAFLAGVTVFWALAMVLPVEMLALKFKGFGWSENKAIYIFLIICIALLLLTALPYIIAFPVYLDYLIIPIIMAFYFAYSLVQAVTSR